MANPSFALRYREIGGEGLTGKTHFAIGVASGVGLAVASGNPDDVGELALTIVLAGIASLLPDIDEDGSLINNFLFPSLSRTYRSFALAALGLVMILLFFIKSLPLWVLLMGVFAAGVAYAPHRSVTHSILTCAYVTWMFYTIQPWMSVPVLVGYLSHLFADTLTSAGVPYLWPYKKKFSMKAFGIKVKTGGSEEKLIGRLSILLAALGFVYLIGLILYNEVKMAGWF
jgi:inner membrane protein